MARTIECFYREGALMTTGSIEGLTHGPLDGDNKRFYGGEWMICETIMESAAKQVAEALGLRWRDDQTGKGEA